MKNKPIFFLILSFIFIRMLILLADSSPAGFCEAFRATCAYDFLTGKNLNIFDYTFRHNEGGSLAVALMTSVIFKIFGVSVFSLHLTPLIFSLFSFLIGLFLVKKYYGIREAVFFGILYIFAPQTYIQLSLIAWGNHVESILFTFLIIYCLGNISAGIKIHKAGFFALLGFVCGFSIWFAYINMVGVLAGMLYLFIFDRGALSIKRALIFLAFFIIGISPLISYNIFYAHGKAGVVLYKPLYVHFMNFSITKVSLKFYSLAVHDLPMSLFFRGVLFVPRGMLAYSSYACMLLFLAIPMAFKIKSGRAKLFFSQEGRFLDIFIYIYVIVFFFVYLISDFAVDPGNIFKGYRYLAAIVPVILIAACRVYGFLSRERPRLTTLIYIYLLICFMGIVNLIGFNNILKRKTYSPLSYQSIGWSIANKFGDDFKKCVAYSDKMKAGRQRFFFFFGLGEEISNWYIHAPDRLNTEFKVIPKEYRIPFYISLGQGLGGKLSLESDNIFAAIHKIDNDYRQYVYMGLGAHTGLNSKVYMMERLSGMVSEDYLCSFYKGVGGALFSSLGYNLNKTNDALLNIGVIKDKYKHCCFSGLGLVFLDENINAPEIYYKILESSSTMVDGKYRDDFLEGLKEGRSILPDLFKESTK